jgi:anti-sigma regulatory factor (Ser/Thr protein kinase)
MILSELFNNALEHGLLELDSNIKTTQEGFETYLSERSLRLQALREGRIDITLERLMLNQRLAIKVYMRDSGKGFDHVAVTAKADETPQRRLHGRGIMLVKALSHSLQYLGAGNEVVAYYLV